MEFSYGEFSGTLSVQEYLNGRPALSWDDSEGLIDVLSINIPEVSLGFNHIIMNTNGSFSQGIIQKLVNEGVLGKQVGEVTSGFCIYPIYILLLK